MINSTKKIPGVQRSNSFTEKGTGISLKKLKVIFWFALLAPFGAYAQDPILPSTNLGLANAYDGFARPGFIYQGFAQYFQTQNLYDNRGNKIGSDLKINSLLMMNQMIYVSSVKVLNGNLAFTVLIPIVQISSSSLNSPAPSVNPGVLGDVIQGTAIQWSGRKLFGKPFSHRAEFDFSLPIGAYDSRYNVNPSAHLWNYEVYHAFTIILNDKISISARNQLNYNAHVIGTRAKPGAFYNGNYSVDYGLFKNFKVEAVAYYLTQLNQDSFDGHSHYYQETYGLNTTKEHVLGYGPGLVLLTPNGVLIEAKIFFETDIQNRFSGNRPTLRLTIPLSK